MTYPYTSGHCDVGHHDHCTGAYAGTPCTCPCHLVCPTCGGTGRIERQAA